MLKTAFILLSILIFSSCERAVQSDTTQIILNLPDQTGLQHNTDKVLAQSLDVINTFNITSNNQFLDILPTGFDSGGDAPINCYLVTVSGPEDFMNVNYCGKDDGNGEISKDYTFGTYVGYVSANSEVKLDVPSGKNRVVRLFGFHVTDTAQCKDVRANPLKNTMSFPYYVGRSDEFNLNGLSQDVVVSLSAPITSTRLDSCEISVLNTTVSEADSSILNTSSFPYGSLRVPTAGHTCEQLNINLFNQGTSFNPAGMLFRTSYSLESTTDGTNFVTRPIYSTYERCNLNVSSQSVFAIPETNFSRAVWSRFVPSDNNITGLRIKPTSNLSFNAVNRVITTSTAPETTYKFDILGLPSLMLNNTCYPIRLAIRNLYGEHPTAIMPGQYVIDPTINSSTVGQIYSDVNCTTTVPNISFSTNQTVSSQMYIKLEVATPTTQLGSINISRNTGDTNLLNTSIPFKVSHNQPVPNVRLSRLSFTGMPVVVKATAAERCIPITLNFRDNNNLPFKLTATGSLDLLLSDSNSLVSGLNFYSNSDCATGLISSAVVLPLNSNYYTFYMSVSDLTTTGPRNLIVKVNNLITTRYYFVLIAN